MSELRNTPYGYVIEKGAVRIQPDEAKIVSEIFDKYLSGETLKVIADGLTARQVIYYKDKTVWTKNIIARIISNDKYIGADNYPGMISKEIFADANRTKTEKGAHKTELPELTEYIKSQLVCRECGCKFKRINKWKTREKWLCTGGCKCLVYLDDKVIKDAVLSVINRGIQNPELLELPTETETPISTEITKKTNDIYRMMETATEFGSIAKLILDCTSAKYEFCQSEFNPELTAVLHHYFAEQGIQKELSIQFLKTAVKKIVICSDGELIIRFADGSKLSNKMKEENGDGRIYRSQNNYKD